MIRQYLSQTNENTTVPILQNFLELNKAWVYQSLAASQPGGLDQQGLSLAGLALGAAEPDRPYTFYTFLIFWFARTRT